MLYCFQQQYRMASPSQMFSSTPSKFILHSPHNTSSSKFHYSVPKNPRFKVAPVYCENYYTQPSTKSNRGTSFGYGKKTDLDAGKHPHNKTPDPAKYTKTSFVEDNKKHHKGWTTRESRDAVTPMSYIELEPKKVPGPGRYEHFEQPDKDYHPTTPHWTMHIRYSSQIFPQTTTKIVPGPKYDNKGNIGSGFEKKGQYVLSSHRKCRAKTFNPPHSARFTHSMTQVPPPNNYKPQNNMSDQGKYVLSRHVSAGKRTFMNGKRATFIDKTKQASYTPGPGMYRPPSDFGHYDNKVQAKTAAKQKRPLTGRVASSKKPVEPVAPNEV